MEVERTFRGITAEMAMQYLERVGGERVGDERIEGSDSDGGRVEGDGWTATVETREPVAIGPTIKLTPVAVTFEGDEDALDEVIDRFAQKAMRAGG